MIKLHEIIERQSWEQSQMKERLAAFSAHVTELEEDLDTARKDVLKFKDMNRKLKRTEPLALEEKPRFLDFT